MAADPFEQILADAISAGGDFVGAAVLCRSVEAADKLRRILYIRRAKAQRAGNHQYDGLSISFSPHANDILYVYRKSEDNAEESRASVEEGDGQTVHG